PSVGLLQPIKGAIIAMQWFGGMHGFARLRARRHQGIRHRDGVRNGARPDLPHDRRSVASLCGDLAKSRSSRALCGSDSPRSIEWKLNESWKPGLDFIVFVIQDRGRDRAEPMGLSRESDAKAQTQGRSR